MRVTIEYNLGGHKFSVNTEDQDLKLMSNYSPFVDCGHPTIQQNIFTLNIKTGNPVVYSEEMRQEDESQTIISGRTSDGCPVFEFLWVGESGGWLVCSKNYKEGNLIITGLCKKATIDNAMMVIYALSTADKKTVLFHAAAVSHNGKGYMFLGRSGTGKSTHARLWKQYIEGTELVNDDNPIVRVDDNGKATIYGSPWSGKTPCYRNVSYQLDGIVLLNQAPYNKIYRMKGIRAYAAIIPSISGTRWDNRIADGLHETESELIAIVPIWKMQCLPDREAAYICWSALFRHCTDSELVL